MTDWSAGYVADIGYTYGYYAELNPLRARLALLNAGLAVPEIRSACELGFGQGISTNVHAAASATEWYGTDFNPSQAAFARELAHVAGARARLYDEAFAEFARRSDLPEFDFIGLHGIWSWISDENRAVIVDFIRRKLKVGGILYISYNTLPGWTNFAPMRHLMTEHASVMGAEGRGIVNRVDGAIDFADKLLATNPLFALANPQAKGRIDAIKGQNRQYLAHEYFNRDWAPMYFADMASWLAPAKLQYACSAHYLDHVDSVNLTQPQVAFLKEIPDPLFRQGVRDFMVNQQFRRDYWIKGTRQLSAIAQAEQLRAVTVMLSINRSDVSLKTTGALGEGNMSETVYGPILDSLADRKPRTIAEIERAVSGHGIRISQVVEALVVLSGAGTVVATQDKAITGAARPHCDRINAHIMDAARGGGDIGYLASPVTGGAIGVVRFRQLFLLAIKSGRKQPEDWARFTWDILNAQNQRLMKEGRALESAEENIAELVSEAHAFEAKQLASLKALQIA
jgi:SAM-dependent methyltransferase